PLPPAAYYYGSMAHTVRILIAAVVFIGAAAAYSVHFSSDEPQTAEWEARIGREGGAPAYAAFQKSVADVDLDTQHWKSHIFGKALYDALGDDGFVVCGDTFRYGCAHGFMARAIQHEGESAVRKFADACRKEGGRSSCLHGIGHGLTLFFG